MFKRVSATLWSVVVMAFLVFGLSGCGRAGPAVGKALFQKGEGALVQNGEKALERSASQAGKTATRQESRFEKWEEKGRKFFEDHGDDLADLVPNPLDDRQNQQNVPPAPRMGDGQRFPLPLSSVQPLAGYEPRVDPDSGDFSLPNNYGGVILYDSSGSPLGFSARNKSTSELDCFDRFGNRR
jgi:hypothetical protein